MQPGCSASVNALLLLIGLLKQGIYRPLPGWWLLLAKGLLASLAMGLALWFLSGGLCYLLLALALGLRPRHLLRMNPAA